MNLNTFVSRGILTDKDADTLENFVMNRKSIAVVSNDNDAELRDDVISVLLGYTSVNNRVITIADEKAEIPDYIHENLIKLNTSRRYELTKSGLIQVAYRMRPDVVAVTGKMNKSAVTGCVVGACTGRQMIYPVPDTFDLEKDVQKGGYDVILSVTGKKIEILKGEKDV